MPAHRYRNPWHKPRDPHYGPEFYETDATPTTYKGYALFRRTPYGWDIVKDGVCLSQRAGLTSAKAFINDLTADRDTLPDGRRSFVEMALAKLNS